MDVSLSSSRSYKLLAWFLPVIIVFAARGLILEKFESIGSHIENTFDFSARLEKSGVHIRELPEMKTDYENLARKKMLIASSLFQAKSEATLYELLFMKAGEANVTVLSIAPRALKQQKGYAERFLSLDVSGSFNNCAVYINKIETVSRLMRVEEVSFSKDHSSRLTASIKLLVYLYADDVSKKDVPKGKKESSFQDRDMYLADLKNALSVQIASLKYVYSLHSEDDPFGRIIVASHTAVPRAKPLIDVPKTPLGLTLKGILWKQPPLVILESVDGVTYILKQGESVNNCKVVMISRSDVTLSTPQGEHVLHQYNPN